MGSRSGLVTSNYAFDKLLEIDEQDDRSKLTIDMLLHPDLVTAFFEVCCVLLFVCWFAHGCIYGWPFVVPLLGCPSPLACGTLFLCESLGRCEIRLFHC